MTRADALRIAGMTVALQCEDDRIRWTWDEPFLRFLVDHPVADADLQIAVVCAEPQAPAGEMIFDSAAVWRMFHDHSGYTIECRSSALGESPYKTASFDESFSRGTIAINPEVISLGLNPLDYPMDEVIVSNLLGRGRGVELHACGIIDSTGRGHLFVGMSGAGKTTTAHLWEGRAAGIVSDDRVIVREQDGAMWMYGTPWHGEAELSLASGAPLSGVYLLEQSDANEVRAISTASAIARLFSCAFPLFHQSTAIDYTLAFLERLAALVPVRELRFVRDPSVVALILGEAA